MVEEKQTLRISLVPEGGEMFRAVNVKKRLIIFIFFLAFCILTVLAGVVILKRFEKNLASKINTSKLGIEGVKVEIGRLEGDYQKVSRLAKQLNAARLLLDTHPSFVKVLNLIEARTLPEVYYSNFVGSKESRTFVLEAKAPSFDDAARQIVAFREATDKIEKVTVSTVSADVDVTGAIKAVKFTVSVVVKSGAIK